jgi:hypothetical protein
MGGQTKLAIFMSIVQVENAKDPKVISPHSFSDLYRSD